MLKYFIFQFKKENCILKFTKISFILHNCITMKLLQLPSTRVCFHYGQSEVGSEFQGKIGRESCCQNSATFH